MDAPIKLEIINMTKLYKNGDGVKNVNLSVRKGELVTLLGPSGCGKTTILRTIGGFIELSGGDVQIDGKSIIAISPEKRPTSMNHKAGALGVTAYTDSNGISYYLMIVAHLNGENSAYHVYRAPAANGIETASFVEVGSFAFSKDFQGFGLITEAATNHALAGTGDAAVGALSPAGHTCPEHGVPGGSTKCTFAEEKKPVRPNCTTCDNVICRRKWRVIIWRGCGKWREG